MSMLRLGLFSDLLPASVGHFFMCMENARRMEDYLNRAAKGYLTKYMHGEEKQGIVIISM